MVWCTSEQTKSTIMCRMAGRAGAGGGIEMLGCASQQDSKLHMSGSTAGSACMFVVQTPLPFPHQAASRSSVCCVHTNHVVVCGAAAPTSRRAVELPCHICKHFCTHHIPVIFLLHLHQSACTARRRMHGGRLCMGEEGRPAYTEIKGCDAHIFYLQLQQTRLEAEMG